jgi:phosphatidylserine/phosphatidylglycerophosphate/cardiolipin synthase-like enzyme
MKSILMLSLLLLLTGCSIEQGIIGVIEDIGTAKDYTGEAINGVICDESIVYEQTNYSIEPVFCDITHNCAQNLIAEFDKATTSIHILIYNINEPSIVDSLIRAKQRGVEVKIGVDKTQYGQKGMKAEVQRMIDAGIETRIIDVASTGIMHNKIAIIDNKVIIIGSFNYTNNAQKYSKENILLIRDNDGFIYTKYEEYFKIVYE